MLHFHLLDLNASNLLYFVIIPIFSIRIFTSLQYFFANCSRKFVGNNYKNVVLAIKLIQPWRSILLFFSTAFYMLKGYSNQGVGKNVDAIDSMQYWASIKMIAKQQNMIFITKMGVKLQKFYIMQTLNFSICKEWEFAYFLIIILYYQTQTCIILIMNLALFCFRNRFFVSRAKTLLKRRKKHLKSRPISDKKLAEQAKHFNYAKQYKALQIKKELDKKKYASQHINELMDQIFYPDVRLANEQSAKIFIQTSALKQLNPDQKQMDQHEENIRQIVIATEIIDYCLKNKQELNINHIKAACQRFRNYFQKRQKIKQNVQKKWAKMNENMKKKDKNYIEKKCPYLFIDKQDTFHFQPFNQMIANFNDKILQTYQVSQKQQKMQTMLNFSTIIQQLCKGIGYIPEKMFSTFQLLLGSMSKQQIDNIGMAQGQNIIKTVNLKNMIRLPAYISVTQHETPIQQNLKKNKQNLIIKILSSPHTNSYNLADVIGSIKYNNMNLTPQICDSLKNSIMKNLSQMPFEKSVDLFQICLKKMKKPELQLLQLIKFDILRKSPTAKSKNHILKAMEMVKQKFICNRENANTKQVAKQKQIKIYGEDMLLECAKTLMSKYCGKNQLKLKQIIQIVNIYFSNGLRDMNMLQLVANEIVKIRNQASLNQLTDVVFMIFTLGYRSPILTKILVEEQKKRFHQTRNRLKNQAILMITSTAPEANMQLSGSQLNLAQSGTISAQQLKLQESLIVSLWLHFLTVQQSNYQQKISSIDQLMKIYPLSVHSRHPLIFQLVTNLNSFAKRKNLFWQIKINDPSPITVGNHRLDKFYSRGKTNKIGELMRLESLESKKFILNFNMEEKKFLEQAWSKQNIYSKQIYQKYIANSPQDKLNYFNKTLQISNEIQNFRLQVREEYSRKEENNQKQTIQSSNRNIEQKYYEID